MSNTHTPDRQRAASARGAASSATPLFAARSRLIHDWATRVLREEDRDEVLAVLEWLAAHGDRNYLGALAIVSHRFPGDAAIAAAAEAVVGRIGVR
ncbi:MAG: hypothetical protein IH616_18300 [Gemmatimonadales bacterium]|nr:hypothetical protein [Gemmatimonadales bacterium]